METINITKPDLKELLNLAMREENADKASFQKYNSNGELEIVASEGFSKEFLTHFKSVKPFDTSCCGRAFGIGSTIVISDVELDPGFKPNLEIAKREGFRAVKATPIFDAHGNKLGVVSVHFTEPKWNWDLKKSMAILPKLASALMDL